MRLPPLQAIKERKLVQAGLAYLGGAWLLIEVVDVLGATYDGVAGSDYESRALHYQRVVAANPADPESLGLLAMALLNPGEERQLMRARAASAASTILPEPTFA
jgi:hypothetical protein